MCKYYSGDNCGELIDFDYLVHLGGSVLVLLVYLSLLIATALAMHLFEFG